MGIINPNHTIIFLGHCKVIPDRSKGSHHREKAVTGYQGTLTWTKMLFHKAFQIIQVPVPKGNHSFSGGCSSFCQAIVCVFIQEDYLVQSQFVKGQQSCKTAQITGWEIYGIFGIEIAGQFQLYFFKKGSGTGHGPGGRTANPVL